MEETRFDDARAVALDFLADPDLKGKIFLEGGLVPWIISGNASGREHDDVDFSVRAKDMPLIRSWLQKHGLYDAELDSMNIACNKDKEEFGVHALVNGVMVSFAPYEIVDNKIVQRNGVHASFAGYDALFVATIADLDEADFVEMRTFPQGLSAGAATIESVRAAKVATGREKDSLDIAEIDRIGFDEERFTRVSKAFETMIVECQAHSE